MISRVRVRTTPIVQMEAPDPPSCPYILRSIEMDNVMSSFKFGDVLTGKITLEIVAPTDFTGLWLQLEGTAISRVEIPPDQMPMEDKTARFATFEAAIIGKGNPAKAPATLTIQTEHVPKGEHTFGFKMEITEKTLPASFELYFAAVEYIFSVYCEFYEGKTCWRYSSNLEPFDYNGHVNIIDSHAKLLQPLKITRGGSFFKNKRPSVRVTVYKRACLPGETIEGTLEIENPTSETLRDIQVSLVRKIMHADAWTRRLKTWLVVEERLELDDAESRELNWNFSLELPKDLMPTYRRMRHVLDIFYILQFSVKAESEDLKGDTEVIIGTHGVFKEPKEDECVAGSSKSFDEDSMSRKSLPPSYSLLSSRRPSVSSVPPAYNTVCEKVEKAGTSRRLSVA